MAPQLWPLLFLPFKKQHQYIQQRVTKFRDSRGIYFLLSAYVVQQPELQEQLPQPLEPVSGLQLELQTQTKESVSQVLFLSGIRHCVEIKCWKPAVAA